MLHAKFQDHGMFCRRRFLKGFMINRNGGYLGHVTGTIYINFCFPFPSRLYMKFDLFGFGEDNL